MVKHKRTKPQKPRPKHHKVKAVKKLVHYSLANIKVVGIGGGGGNAISRMSRHFGRSVDFVAIRLII